MKVCIVSQTFAPQEEGGAEISARLGAIELGERHDVTVLSLGMEGDPLTPPGETYLASGIRVVRLPWSNSYLPLPRKSSANLIRRAAWHVKTALGAVCSRQLTQFLETEKFDLVYAQNSAYLQPALFIAARQANVPICLHLRDYALLCPKTSMFRNGHNCERPCLDCSILNRRMREMRGEGMTVIAVSDALRQRFAENDVLQSADWHVMHNTNVTEKSFDKTIVGRRKPAADGFTFGYLGALADEKGVTDLVRAFSSLPKHGGARLLIAGRGRDSYLAKLKRLAADASVEFKGFVKPEEIYRKADAVIVPSRWHEPQSRILIEAPVYGVPVIATSRGGTTEIINGHKIGWCYDPDRPDALKSLLARALEIGQKDWWAKRDELFPGIAAFRGTAEQSSYYDRLETILLDAAGFSTAPETLQRPQHG